jgi:hypothetical protein
MPPSITNPRTGCKRRQVPYYTPRNRRNESLYTSKRDTATSIHDGISLFRDNMGTTTCALQACKNRRSNILIENNGKENEESILIAGKIRTMLSWLFKVEQGYWFLRRVDEAICDIPHVYITDRGFTRQEVLNMENEILTKLCFKISVSTGHPFLQRFLFITNATTTMKFAANYYMERVLQEHEFLAFRPSIIAAAAVCLALNHPGIRENDSLTVENPGVVRTVFPDSIRPFTRDCHCCSIAYCCRSFCYPAALHTPRIHGVFYGENPRGCSDDGI